MQCYKYLKKVAAVLAASMALNAVAFTGAFSASAEEDVTVIGTSSLKGQMGTYKPVQITNEDGAVDTIDLLDLSLEVAQKGAGLPATFDDRKVKLADLDDSGDLDSTDAAAYCTEWCWHYR